MTNKQVEKIMATGSEYLNMFDLGHLFEKIVRSWGADHVRILGAPPAEIPDLSLERSVILSGSLNALLTARSSPEFAAWLRDQRQDTPLGRFPSEGVFEELVSFFSLSLYHRFWKPHSFQIGPIKPYPSQSEFWPFPPPYSACALDVENYRVELRLWIKD